MMDDAGQVDAGQVDAATAGWLDRVRDAPVGRLGTRSGTGRIDLVPFVYAWLEGAGPLGRLVSVVDHKPKRSARLRRLDNVAVDPQVTVLVDHYEDEWTALWWVRLRGLGHELAAGPERDDALVALAAKYHQYRERPPTGAVLAIDVVELRGWAGAGGPISP